MLSKHQYKLLIAARATFIKVFKKRKLEASSVNIVLQQPSVYNNKPRTIDTSLAGDTNDEKEIATWFWNKNVNKTDSDEEEEDIGDVDRKAKT